MTPDSAYYLASHTTRTLIILANHRRFYQAILNDADQAYFDSLITLHMDAINRYRRIIEREEDVETRTRKLLIIDAELVEFGRLSTE